MTEEGLRVCQEDMIRLRAEAQRKRAQDQIAMGPDAVAVPKGKVVISHAGNFKGDYLSATLDDVGDGRRFIHLMKMDGSPQENPQACWMLKPIGDKFVIYHAGDFSSEYLYATQMHDGDGRRFVHTWMKGGSPEADPQALWVISRINNTFVIYHAGRFIGEYLYAAQNDTVGRRSVHTWTCGGSPVMDTQALWMITPV